MRTFFRKHRLLIISGLLGISAAAISHAAVSPYVVASPVVVAAREIRAYEPITEGDVKIVELPKKAVPKDHFADTGPLRGAYALSRILPGQIIMSGHVARGKGEIGLSVELEWDMRCVFVPAGEERAVGGLIKRGEMVDLVFTPKGASYVHSAGAGQSPLVVRGLPVVEVCRNPSSGDLLGIVVLARRAEAEEIAGSIETCAVSVLLAPREVREQYGETEPEVWLPW
ncbi:MAG TPA: Flp pilus assembly protein CpaB [Firmicutes bacterium]|nr:Flp pilus assembly protein CpaB [Candidatus Fermentithermobacillaceae bacterium]